MKYVLLAIFVLFAAQPLRASLCDMHDAQGTTQGAHGDMHDSDMDHSNMQNMDCCDHDPADPVNPADSNDLCDSMSHCGAGTASAVVLNSDMITPVYTAGSRQYLSNSGAPLYWFKSPPFRPPIA